MEASDILQDLKTSIQEVKDGGQNTIAVDALTRYLDELGRDAASSIELRKLEYQQSLAHYDAQVKSGLEMFKSVLEAGREALKALVLINGGAVVALLGFMGATLNKDLPASLGYALSRPVLLFGIGVLVGAMGFGLRYVSQACYAYSWKLAGHAANIASIVLAISGYALFGIGVFQAFTAFNNQFAA
jgi:hypothetical protein